jgi:hypothetical protein
VDRCIIGEQLCGGPIDEESGS